MHYFPVTAPFVLLLFLVFGVILALVQLGIIEYAYSKIGIQPRWIFLFLILSLLGSYVNIPIAEVPANHLVENETVSDNGIQYVVPDVASCRERLSQSTWEARSFQSRCRFTC